MPFNAKPLILSENVFSKGGTLTATDTDADSSFSVDNLINQVVYQLWKSKAVNLNVLTNPGFETGDFTGWAAGNAVIDNTHSASGTYSSKLVASGSDVFGPSSDRFTVEAGSVYSISAKVDVDIRSAGTHRLKVRFFDSSDSLISDTSMKDWTAITSGYETVIKTVGPSSASPDINFPADTVSISVQVIWFGTPTGTAYLDDVDIHAIAKHITVDLNKTINGGFEAGDLSNWVAAGSVIGGTEMHSGQFSSALITVGSEIFGCRQNVNVDPTKIYTVSSWHKVFHTAGSYIFGLVFYPEADGGGTFISTSDHFTVATTVNWTQDLQTIGPAGSGADIIFPSGTKSVTMRPYWTGTPTGTAHMDDVIIYENVDPDTVGMANHNFWDANAPVSVESSADVTEIISSWTERLPAFTPAFTDKDIILKQFTAVGTAQRAWRVKIVPASIAPYAGDIKLGARIDFPRWTQGPFGPRPRKAEGKLAKNDAGQFLQRVVIRKEAPVTLRFRRLTGTFVWDTLMPAFENDLISGIFYVSWDIDQHETQKMVCFIPDGGTLDPKYSGALLDGVDLTVMPMPVA